MRLIHKMKNGVLVIICGVVMLGAGLFFCVKIVAHRETLKALEQPTYAERLAARDEEAAARYKAECAKAEAAATEWLSRTTTGFRRVKSFWLKDTHSNDPAQWTAQAQVEFINKVGGVEVVTEYLKFERLSSGGLTAMTDYSKKR